MKQDWFTLEEKGQEVIFRRCSEDAFDDIVIPDGVTRVTSLAFANCKSVRSIVFPNSVKKISMFALSNCTGLQYLRIPASVKELGPQKMYAHLSVVDFEGSVLETNRTFEGCSIEVLRVNSTRKSTHISRDVMNALGYGTNWGDPGKIIYATPELYSEEFPLPGYIIATSANTDKPVGINTKYIISVDVLDIERYHPVSGSRITCAVEESCQYHHIDVYESCGTILEKIQLSQKQENYGYQ